LNDRISIFTRSSGLQECVYRGELHQGPHKERSIRDYFSEVGGYHSSLVNAKIPAIEMNSSTFLSSERDDDC
jgi:hypothetical protein